MNQQATHAQRSAPLREDVLAFVGVPTHDGRIDIGVANAILKASRLCLTAVQFNSSSLLANNFNQLYCNALNLRRGGMPITHFCLLHCDVVPDSDNWLNEMILEMDEHGLDVISAVTPIKDGRGLTSTAMCMSAESDRVKATVRRITLHESMMMPTTFDAGDAATILKEWTQGCSSKLLINTGLLVIDLRCKYAEELFFTINDSVRSVVVDDVERLVPVCEPEDWCFSRLLAKLGVRYAATRAVLVKHIGRFQFDSRITWGYQLDPAHFPVETAESDVLAPACAAKV